MNVSLTPELERQVEERVSSGLYTSASEVVREALRLFLRFDAVRADEINRLNRRISEGLVQLDQGEAVDGDAAWRQNRERAAARRVARRAAESR